jgi:hypothetical protein
MKPNLEMYWSDFGYLDPKDLERQELFVENEREEFIEDAE